eukprot:g61131.t1
MELLQALLDGARQVVQMGEGWRAQPQSLRCKKEMGAMSGSACTTCVFAERWITLPQNATLENLAHWVWEMRPVLHCRGSVQSVYQMLKQFFEPHAISDCAYRCQRCDKTEGKRAIVTMNVLYGWPAILRLNFTRRITGNVNDNQTWEVDAPSELICPKADRTWQREAWDRSTSSRTSDTSACVRYKLFAVAVHNKAREDGGHNWLCAEPQNRRVVQSG